MDKNPVVLEIDLSLGLQSGVPQDPLSAIRARYIPRLPTIIAGLRHGAKDDSVVAAIVHVTPAVTVWQAEELIAALRGFRHDHHRHVGVLQHRCCDLTDRLLV